MGDKTPSDYSSISLHYEAEWSFIVLLHLAIMVSSVSTLASNISPWPCKVWPPLQTWKYLYSIIYIQCPSLCTCVVTVFAWMNTDRTKVQIPLSQNRTYIQSHSTDLILLPQFIVYRHCLIHLFTSTSDVMFLPLCVCLSVCLYVWQLKVVDEFWWHFLEEKMWLATAD